MDTREDNSGKTAYPYLERVKAFAEEVYQEEMAELKKKNPNSAPAHATTFDVRWRVHCGAPTVEEQSEQAKPDLFDHLAEHPDTKLAPEG